MATLTKRDPQIRADVIDEMSYDPAVKVRDLAVIVVDGVVTLSGSVASCRARQAAVNAAWRVNGVSGVNDDLILESTLPGVPTDGQIADAVRERLRKDFLIPRDRITVSVRDGVVTLRGAVDWQYQRVAAYEEARDALGVRGVNNEITISAFEASAQEIEAAIRRALTRDAQVEASQIQVRVEGGHITLSGKARSFAERHAAEEAAWRARGVTDVTNTIVIQPY
jgi:osmotically-inducible protein OsmY